MQVICIIYLKANQRLNNEDFNIIDADLITKIDYGVFVTPGVQMKLSDFVTVYSEFRYMLGLANVETGDSDQKASNSAYIVSLGLSFAIKSSGNKKAEGE